MGATAADVGVGGCIPTPKYTLPTTPILEKPAAAAPAKGEAEAKPAPSKAAAPAKAKAAKPAGLAQKKAEPEAPAAEGKKEVKVADEKVAEAKPAADDKKADKKLDEAHKSAIAENISVPKDQSDDEKAKAESEKTDAAAAAVASPPKVVPLDSDTKGDHDNRANTDAARATAAKQVASQNKDESDRVAAITASHDKATEETAKSINANNRKREGAHANNWHEYWVTKVQP